jgi:hypothetical protein
MALVPDTIKANRTIYADLLSINTVWTEWMSCKPDDTWESGINLARAVVIMEAMGATTREIQHRRGKVQNDAALRALPRVMIAH